MLPKRASTPAENSDIDSKTRRERSSKKWKPFRFVHRWLRSWTSPQPAINSSKSDSSPERCTYLLQDHKPWELIKGNPRKCQSIVRAGAGVAKVLAALLQPFMPSISQKILHQLNLEWTDGVRLDSDAMDAIGDPLSILPSGHRIRTPMPLFVKISDDALQNFREQFKGKQGDAPMTKKRNYKKTEATSKTRASDAAVKKPTVKEPTVVDVRRLDLRVGRIIRAWRHPDADSLYVEEIDVGEEMPRTVVSGLVKYIPEAEMQDRWVVLVCNMKSTNMRGIKSQAMVLAAKSEDDSVVELVQPAEGSRPGERIRVEGYEGEPDATLNPKKKIFEAIQPDLKTDEECIACYKNVPLKTAKGPCRAASVKGGSIS